MMRSVPLVALFATSASAAPGTERVIVDTPRSQFTAGAFASRTLYLNRCSGGCIVHGGTINDARNQASSIPPPGDFPIAEFATVDGMTGAAADAEWAAVVKCVREVYSPFALTVTDVMPSSDSYTEAIVAGFPTDLHLSNDILGIAPLATDCSPQANVISFSFANHHPMSDRVRNICWTAAQESAHAFGLDHEYAFKDGSSACTDPMTYRTDCGGQRFFRDRAASCGEYAKRACRCGATQNSHQQLTAIFGAATSITTGPHAEILVPPATAMTVTSGFTVQAAAGTQRGVDHVELWLNNSPWVTKGGAAFGTTGQLDPSTYALISPKTVPDGVIDIEVRAYDDLGAVGVSTMLTVTKGVPCTSAASCLTDQKCTAGKCFWDPPTAELGGNCNYAQECKSNKCVNNECVKPCDPDVSMSCPAGYTCASTGGETLCASTGGCCDAGGDPRAAGFFALLIFGLIRRRW